MALVTTVTPATIAVALGLAAPASGSITEARYNLWIADALMLVQIRYDSLEDDTVVVDQDRLDYVIREAVVAHAQRPDSSTQVSTSVDDATVAKTFSTGKGRVSILDEWWTMLGLTTTSGSGAFSFRPYGTGLGASAHQPWCSLAFGALYCSCGADLTNESYPLYEF
jgi:hypothetical protein